MPEQKPYRLPLTVTPQRYEIRLTPDMASATFDGEERVAIQVNEPVREIRLNAAELAIQEVSIKAKSGKTIRGGVTLDPENEQAALQFAETVGPGPWELQIKFSGILNDKLHGFYRSAYKNADGEEKSLATTQFESTDARRAFPCWDEPALKAVFQVTLIVDEGLTAISNARVIRETSLPGAGKKETIFADSMKMSTYLVAFIVGEFEASDPVMVGKAPLRVWAVPGKAAGELRPGDR
jgi:puromycin-sensitive aminopeptidase